MIFFLVLVGVVCLGVPGVTAGAYFLQENGPYHTIPSVCRAMSGDLAKQYTGGLAGRPADANSSCSWGIDGEFVLQARVEFYHRKKFTDSVEHAQEMYEFAVKLDRDFATAGAVRVEQPTAPIGDEGFLSYEAQQSGKTVWTTLSIIGRSGNAVINISYHRLAKDLPQAPSFDQAEQALRDLHEQTEELYNDIAEDVR